MNNEWDKAAEKFLRERQEFFKQVDLLDQSIYRAMKAYGKLIPIAQDAPDARLAKQLTGERKAVIKAMTPLERATDKIADLMKRRFDL